MIRSLDGESKTGGTSELYFSPSFARAQLPSMALDPLARDEVTTSPLKNTARSYVQHGPKRNPTFAGLAGRDEGAILRHRAARGSTPRGSLQILDDHVHTWNEEEEDERRKQHPESQ